MKKKIFLGISIPVILLIGYLCLPSGYFLRKALIYQLPKIDHYTIFENRIVEAKDPKPWETAINYNTLSIPDKYHDLFEQYGTIAFVIIKDGQLLFEEYWEDYSPVSVSNSFSMAKSIVALGIGCALDDGVIKSLDQTVQEFFPEFNYFQGNAITIRHLLTMSAGVDFEEAYSSPFSPTTQIYYGNNLKKITFNMQAIEKPGTYVEYQSGVTQLLAFILEKATGERISEYISRKLWTPMQAEENALWSLDHKDGMEKAYCCFNSNARDFARFGQLILNKGCWNGKQLISASYLQEAVTPDSTLIYRPSNQANQVYGYQFWHLTYQGYSIPYLRGILGQYVFAIPEKNMVVVRLGHKRSESRTSQHYPDDINTWLQAALDMVN